MMALAKTGGLEARDFDAENEAIQQQMCNLIEQITQLSDEHLYSMQGFFEHMAALQRDWVMAGISVEGPGPLNEHAEAVEV